MINQIYVIESRMCFYPFLFWFFIVDVVVFLLMWLSMAPVVSVQMLLMGQLQT